MTPAKTTRPTIVGPTPMQGSSVGSNTSPQAKQATAPMFLSPAGNPTTQSTSGPPTPIIPSSAGSSLSPQVNGDATPITRSPAGTSSSRPTIQAPMPIRDALAGSTSSPGGRLTVPAAGSTTAQPINARPMPKCGSSAEHNSPRAATGISVPTDQAPLGGASYPERSTRG